jgi:hypothetical protein
MDCPCPADREGGGRAIIFAVALVEVRVQRGGPGAQDVLAAAGEGMGVAAGQAHIRGLACRKVGCTDEDRVPLRFLRNGDSQRAEKDQDPESHRKTPELDGDSLWQ